MIDFDYLDKSIYGLATAGGTGGQADQWHLGLTTFFEGRTDVGQFGLLLSSRPEFMHTYVVMPSD